jgi:hypothetical protein
LRNIERKDEPSGASSHTKHITVPQECPLPSARSAAVSQNLEKLTFAACFLLENSKPSFQLRFARLPQLKKGSVGKSVSLCISLEK